MARVILYDTPRDPRLKGFSINKMVNEENHFFYFGETAEIARIFDRGPPDVIKFRNQVIWIIGNMAYNQNMEAWAFTTSANFYMIFWVFCWT